MNKSADKTKKRRDLPSKNAGRIRPVWISRSPEETRSCGEALGRRLTGGEMIALEGNLGAGKTHLIQGMARGLGVTDPTVTSPTFVYLHEFRGRHPLAHVDLFRIEREADLFDLGLFEYLDGPWVVAIEWADKAGGALPAERLTIRLTQQDETTRRIEFEATGERYQALLSAFTQRARRARGGGSGGLASGGGDASP
ncbi:MAG TPA: tRNA (adenosine(37)-N6)-threonylcarbamoyltransferase complex ATPase subunit type 1 TsaE [Nitrospiria bacterium]|jgi:tRNA threonylcarbamoyladenosine biosynthesis protein TsaE|nr:tRNA (adenosine(37)-N6)-threonylcarbamoyltransferase complex ATPase subunit type 1 TsaE [Nitrospiria bacterium]